jgi:glutathione S-transferase
VLPEQLDIVDELIDGGAVGGDEPTALDYQIGSSLHLLLQIGDVRPLIVGRPAEALVDSWFERGPADVPAGAFPAGWVPAPSPSAAA